jgi:HTH-type transcriptional regulator, sugar sensing transcriptional regulator
MTTQSDTYLKTSLRQLGLSEHESLVYLVCLHHSAIKIMEIAQKTNISRTTVYGVVDDLVKKGLLNLYEKSGHKYISATDPQKLQVLVESQREVVEKRQAFLNSIFPTLSMFYQEGDNKPIISFYQGQKEVRQIFEDFLISGVNEAVFIGETQTISDALGEKYLKDMIRRRIEKGIYARGVRTEGTELEDYIYKSGNKNFRSIRLAPKDFKCPTYIGIYGNKVFIVSSARESYGVLIESKDLATTLRAWFEVLWGASKAA